VKPSGQCPALNADGLIANAYASLYLLRFDVPVVLALSFLR